MKLISLRRHRFPADVIRQAVSLCFRLALSIRDVEALLAKRGIEASYGSVHCWVIKFGPLLATDLRRRCSPTGRWHLDELFVRIGGWGKVACGPAMLSGRKARWSAGLT